MPHPAPPAAAVATLLCLALLPAGAHDLPGLAAERNTLERPLREQLDAQTRLRRLNAQRAASAPTGDGQPEAVIQTALRWPQPVVTVCFFDGSAGARAAVAAIAGRWTEGSGVRFDFGPGPTPATCNPQRPADVRVSFAGAGHWSYVGTVAKSIAAGQPTMNLQRLDEADLNAPYNTFVVLHEFGHALGFEHEHQSPAEGCDAEFDWNWILTRMGWNSESEARQNMARFNESSRKTGLLATPFDRDSVMLYALNPAAFRAPDKARCYIAAANTQPSAQDRAALRILYPPRP